MYAGIKRARKLVVLAITPRGFNLVIDDNHLIRVLASRLLAGAGFAPFVAPDGPSALLLLDAQPVC